MKAVFSNGRNFTYTGKRAVKAAWLIVFPDGSELTGFSASEKSALSTCRQNLRLSNGVPLIESARSYHPDAIAYYCKVFGVKNMRQVKVECKRRCDDFESKCVIEVVKAFAEPAYKANIINE